MPRIIHQRTYHDVASAKVEIEKLKQALVNRPDVVGKIHHTYGDNGEGRVAILHSDEPVDFAALGFDGWESSQETELSDSEKDTLIEKNINRERFQAKVQRLQKEMPRFYEDILSLELSQKDEEWAECRLDEALKILKQGRARVESYQSSK